jgi:hypothetical protein
MPAANLRFCVMAAVPPRIQTPKKPICRQNGTIAGQNAWIQQGQGKFCKIFNTGARFFDFDTLMSSC